MKPSPNISHFITWIAGLILEIILLGESLRVYTTKKHTHVIANRQRQMTVYEIVETTIDAIRVVLLMSLVGLYFGFVTIHNWRHSNDHKNNEADETTGLLNGNGVTNGANGDNHSSGYGSTPNHQKDASTGSTATIPGWTRPVKVPKKNWWDYIHGYKVFFPYLWPAKDRKLQVVMIICFVIVLVQRGINVLVPDQLGVITDILGGELGPVRIPWLEVSLYIFYRFLQGNMGLLGAIRGTLWIPVSQYSYQALSTAAFEHVHSLSLDFHLGKKTGEVLSALSKGNAINSFLENITFQVIPMLVDLGVAIVYFIIFFDAYYAMIVAIVTFSYLYITVRLAQWRVDVRRQMVNANREEDAVK
jgi:ATP-binding cassette, subfamily B, vacuolar membrane transporter HMT1/ACLQ